jgi:hypothetical protein
MLSLRYHAFAFSMALKMGSCSSSTESRLEGTPLHAMIAVSVALLIPSPSHNAPPHPPALPCPGAPAAVPGHGVHRHGRGRPYAPCVSGGGVSERACTCTLPPPPLTHPPANYHPTPLPLSVHVCCLSAPPPCCRFCVRHPCGSPAHPSWCSRGASMPCSGPSWTPSAR